MATFKKFSAALLAVRPKSAEELETMREGQRN
jgi:hypothetical protein